MRFQHVQASPASIQNATDSVLGYQARFPGEALTTRETCVDLARDRLGSCADRLSPWASAAMLEGPNSVVGKRASPGWATDSVAKAGDSMAQRQTRFQKPQTRFRKLQTRFQERLTTCKLLKLLEATEVLPMARRQYQRTKKRPIRALAMGLLDRRW